MKKILSVFFALALALGLSGCGTSDDTTTSSSEGAFSGLSGTISLNGSTSMEELVNMLSEVVSESYPDVALEAQFTGSTSGIEALIAGNADIGDASRGLKDEELAEGLVENIVAIDGIGIIVNNENGVTDISTEDLVKIFTGEITNWSELGGDDESIVVIGRESGSGTRGAFEEILDVEDACDYAQEVDSTGGVIAKVSATEGAIGYASLSDIEDTVTAVNVDGVECTTDTIADGSYTIARPFVMATKGEISEQSELVQALFSFLDSEDGQAVIEKAGLVIPS